MSFNSNNFICPMAMYDNNEISGNMPHLIENCIIDKNFPTLASYDKTFDDTKVVYDRTYLYSVNLSLGIAILGIGIFYHF